MLPQGRKNSSLVEKIIISTLKSPLISDSPPPAQRLQDRILSSVVCLLKYITQTNQPTMNGPCGMYKMEPIHFVDNVKLPTCMYKMRNIHDESRNEILSETNRPDLAILEERQERILRQLDELKAQLQLIRNQSSTANKTPEIPRVKTGAKIDVGQLTALPSIEDIVICAKPEHPPWSILILYKLYKDQIQFGAQCHVHSSIKAVSARLRNFFMEKTTLPRSQQRLTLTLIWKDVGSSDPEMMVNPVTQVAIKGEVNIARYLAHLVGLIHTKSDAVYLTDVDTLLDLAHSFIIHGSNKERQAAMRQLNSRLGKSAWLVGSSISIADIAVWSALHQVHAMESAPANVKKWLKNCRSFSAFVEVENGTSTLVQ